MGSSALVRLRARLRAVRLDACLIAGSCEPADALCRARAELLLAPKTQRGLAECLRRALARAGQRDAWSAVTPVTAAAGHDARAALEQLIARLDHADATAARGVALARRMLIDPGSPLFCDRAGDALWYAARAALLALDAPAPAAVSSDAQDTAGLEAAWHD